jgi:capsular polysaccharide biosynthesis protein
VSSPGADLGRYVATLRRQWVLVVAIVAVSAVAGYVVASLSSATYAATSKVLLDQDRHVDTLLGTTGYAPDPERELNTGVLLITLEPIADDVRRSLDLHESAAALAARVSTATDRNSTIVSITARDADPERAARIANAFAAGYRRYRRETVRDSVDEALASARARRNTLADASERSELDEQVRRLQAIAAFDTGGVEVVHRATAASATVSPRPLVSSFIAGFLGAVLAAAAVVVLTRTDTRVRSEEDLERAVGHPVTGVVHDPGDAPEALLPVAVSLGRPVVRVTSPGPDEGATDVTFGLARAIALTGRSAIVIEADPGDPAFAPVERLPDALLPLAVPGDDGGGSAWTLAAGSASLPRIVALVDAASELADVVLLVGPPAAIGLTDVAADVLLVACLDVTRTDQLQRAVRALAAAEGAPVGVVATTAPPRGALRAAVALLRPEEWRRPAAGRHETASEVTV